MPIQKIFKVGNSLGVTLASSLVKNLSLKPGDQVEVVNNLNNSLIYLLYGVRVAI